MKRLLLAIAIVVAAMMAIAIPASASTNTTVFVDNFNGTALSANWCPNASHMVAGPCNGVQILSGNPGGIVENPAQVSVANGYLNLGMVAQNYTDPSTGIVYPYQAGAASAEWLQEYGTQEFYTARINFPCTASGQIENWPAFWFTPNDSGVDGGGFPGEIDIAEGLGGQLAWHYHFQLPNGTMSNVGGYTPVGDYCGWHTFSVYRGNDMITWRYDGTVVGHIQNGDADLDGVKIDTAPEFPRFDQDVCNASWCGPIVTPADMEVDWFRVTK